MALQQVNISIAQGEDWSNTWTFASADPSGLNNLASQVYYNFAGAGARMTVRQLQDSSSTALVTLSTALGGLAFTHLQAPGGPADPGASAPNAIKATIPQATSLGIAPGVYVFDLFADYPAGLSQQLLAGQLQILSSVTR